MVVNMTLPLENKPVRMTFLVLFLIVFSLIAGIWVGTVSIMSHTYNQCQEHGRVRFQNFILASPLEITCTAVTTSKANG